jgi:hypothetical protein
MQAEGWARVVRNLVQKQQIDADGTALAAINSDGMPFRHTRSCDMHKRRPVIALQNVAALGARLRYPWRVLLTGGAVLNLRCSPFVFQL